MSKRVAFYLRVSTEDQTIENQKLDLEHLAKLEHWTDITFFVDEGISGQYGKDKRPGYSDLFERAADGEFDIVAAWSIDRLGRELKDLIEISDLAQEVGFTLHFYKDKIDTSTASGELFFNITASLAKFERRRLGERISAGLARRKEEGKRVGRVPIPQEKIDRIRELRSAGESVNEIAKLIPCSPATVLRYAS